MLIHSIGNSHAHILTGQKPNLKYGENGDFRSHSIGPVIAYNFKNHHLSSVFDLIKKYDMKNDKVLMFVGEVDCRWHIPYQAHVQNESLVTVTQNVVERYFEAIKEIKKECDVGCFGTHPTTLRGHSSNPEEPVFGEWTVRNATCLIFNEHLKKLCDENSIKFYSIYNKLVDSNNKTLEEYFIDYCHLDYDKVIKFILDEIRYNI